MNKDPGTSTQSGGRAPFNNRLIHATRWLSIFLNLILAVGLIFLTIRVIPVTQTTLSSTAASLRLLSDSIESVNVVLRTSTQALETTSEALLSASTSVEKSTSVVDSAAGVVDQIGDTLIEGSTGALEGIEAAAGQIDRALELLTLLGLFGDGESRGEGGLSESIGELNTVLKRWPGEFTDLSASLNEASDDINGVSEALDEIRADTLTLQADLEQLTNRLVKLSRDLRTTADGLDLWAERLPYAAWGLVVILELLILLNIVTKFSELYRQGS